jgi:hypothetical protein
LTPDDDDPEDIPSTDQPTVDAADPQAVAAAVRRQRKAGDRGAEWWQAALASETGRHEIWALLTEAKTFEAVFAVGPSGFPQPEATWFAAGKRELGLTLYRSLLRIDHAAVCRMHQECDPAFSVPKRKRGD